MSEANGFPTPLRFETRPALLMKQPKRQSRASEWQSMPIAIAEMCQITAIANDLPAAASGMLHGSEGEILDRAGPLHSELRSWHTACDSSLLEGRKCRTRYHSRA